MGQELHYQIIQFFEKVIKQHRNVYHFERIIDEDDIIYRVERMRPLSDVIVHLSDAYSYTFNDFYSKPPLLNNGGFILVARPEAGFDERIVEIARDENIGIGKIGKLLGALNYPKYWLYEQPKEDK